MLTGNFITYNSKYLLIELVMSAYLIFEIVVIILHLAGTFKFNVTSQKKHIQTNNKNQF